METDQPQEQHEIDFMAVATGVNELCPKLYTLIRDHFSAKDGDSMTAEQAAIVLTSLHAIAMSLMGSGDDEAPAEAGD